MNTNHISITGNMGRPGELRFTGSGSAVWGFSLGYTPRRKKGDGWEDAGPTIWFDVTAWSELAEELAERYGEAMGQATVTGRIGSRSWTNKEGVEVEQITITADAVTIIPKGARRQAAPQQAPASDPWAHPVQQPGWNTPATDEPPF